MFNKCLLKSSWYFMKKNSPAAQKDLRAQIAWRLQISLGKKSDSGGISEEAKVRQQSKPVLPGQADLAPLCGHTCTSSSTFIFRFFSLWTMAPEMYHSRQPSSTRIGLPFAAVSQWAAAQLTWLGQNHTALTWVREYQVRHTCLLS